MNKFEAVKQERDGLVLADDLDGKLLEILDLFQDHRAPDETFDAFAARVGDEWWQERLAEPDAVAVGS